MKISSQLLLGCLQNYLKIQVRRLSVLPTQSAMEKPKISVELRNKLEQSRALIRKTLESYQPGEWIVSFNGGKDCTVLLDIVAKMKPSWVTLRAVYVRSRDPFEELECFVTATSKRYEMELLRYEGILKMAIEQLVEDEPKLQAVFLGCRRSDPGCSKLKEMAPTDNDWPPLMRIFPLLEWSYHDIWSYLRAKELPYCSLYDEGYTSLGERHATQQNPNLLVYNDKLGKLTYQAAYELEDSHLERDGRDGAVRKQKDESEEE
ncbi:hypothetical protein KR018_009525 [Drosophila ironensis]|nr:hypothetical protein KR018_009525 [Drosophila ironensis]